MKQKPQKSHEANLWDRTRLQGLSDGIFSFSITLLVLNLLSIALPNGDQQLFPTLIRNWPIFLGYIISFIVIGRYWMAHVRLFQNIKEIDRTLFSLNLVMLFFIAILPFPTEILGTHIGNRDAVIFYALILALTGLAEYMLGSHAYKHHQLIQKNQSKNFKKVFNLFYLGTPLIFLLSIFIALFSPTAAEYLWILVAFVRFGTKFVLGKKRAKEIEDV